MTRYRPVSYYFIPKPSGWPIIGSIGLFLLVIGIINIIHGNWYGHYLFFSGALLLAYMMLGWFGTVIHESLAGLHSHKMDKTYRWGMFWFIASEVAFFGIFFGALFYARNFAVPALAGLISSQETHLLLWPHFKAAWPLLHNPNPSLFPDPQHTIPTFGIPALNTFILLSSAGVVTLSHWQLKKGRQQPMLIFLALAIVLGISFLGFQAYEYGSITSF